MVQEFLGTALNTAVPFLINLFHNIIEPYLLKSLHSYEINIWKLEQPFLQKPPYLKLPIDPQFQHNQLLIQVVDLSHELPELVLLLVRPHGAELGVLLEHYVGAHPFWDCVLTYSSIFFKLELETAIIENSPDLILEVV